MKAPTRLILLTFLALAATPWAAVAPAQQPGSASLQLGPAPTFPRDLAGLEIPERAAAGLPAQELDVQAFAVDPSGREASRLFYLTYYQNAAAPAHGWTGNRASCSAGTTSAAFKDAVLLRINYFRAMAGVPAQVTFSDTYSAKAQQAALMMSVNNQLSHSPPATWTCYTAEGAEAAGKSNLYLGVYGWDAISGYMRDPGSGNGAAGHRRWILYPQTQNMGTGDIPPDGGRASNALWVFDSHMWEARPPVRDTFVAWPPPGYVPYQVVFARWSFSYPSADFSQASVTMTQDGQAVPVVQEAVANGYGENTIVWIPNGMSNGQYWPQPAQDTPYRVTINNVAIGGSPRSFTYDVVVIDPAQATPPPARSDLTGDLKSDVLWRHATQGDVWLWPMNGGQHTAEAFVRTVGDTNWEIRGLGDQTGDGKGDILWRNKVTGQIYLWRMNGATPVSETYVGTVSTAFDVVGTGDFNADGTSDILWRHTTLGDIWIWLMSGATRLGETYIDRVDPGYVVKGVADLDANRKADIVWQHAAQGDVWVWLMNGPVRSTVAYVSTVSELGYRIVSVADFTGDGKADLLWHHDTRGEVWLWTMEGTSNTGRLYVDTVPDVGYRVVGTGDYNGDGKADIMWHHSTAGDVWVWLMNGAVKQAEHYVGTVADTGYHIIK